MDHLVATTHHLLSKYPSAGFLTERELIVRYKGGMSGRKALPGGGPQGTRLGLFLFLILVNAAGFPHLEKYLGKKIIGHNEQAHTNTKYPHEVC